MGRRFNKKTSFFPMKMPRKYQATLFLSFTCWRLGFHTVQCARSCVTILIFSNKSNFIIHIWYQVVNDHPITPPFGIGHAPLGVSQRGKKHNARVNTSLAVCAVASVALFVLELLLFCVNFFFNFFYQELYHSNSTPRRQNLKSKCKMFVIIQFFFQGTIYLHFIYV